ncbi:hypothetical protein GJU39_22370 [Pedobacter petrophilus]|uniref:Peptidase S74 domain-containing protein n=1 Tax=Pedobacter petrophilus TaxID=1908241 RepID=A0A7K0G4U6_9SPHI|nr:hypothetical protein [Pedobacter petrophilus]MRX78825.1 hypothetical protein [Pedobacter petrophilus]
MKKALLTVLVSLTAILAKAQLGANQGDVYEISNNSGNIISNTVMHKIWLYRNSAGSDWYSASVHDGIAVDLSFLEPGISTRAWWERNPRTGEQRWGNSGQTWLTLSDAKLGIGTNVPTAPLQIMSLGGDSRPGGVNAASASTLKLSRAGTPFHAFPESAEFRIGHGSPTLSGSQLDLYLNGAANNTDMPDQQVMTWLYNGHVGIGRTDPGANLHIQNLVGSRPGGVNAPTIPVLRMGRAGTQSYSYSESAEFRIGHGGSNVWGSQLDLYINGGANQTETPDQQVMTWQYNGNVGIGTATPAERLSVNGNIRSKEIKVDSENWPDYVFLPDYQLPSLTQIEQQIKLKGHLPDMPSAKEVELNGIALGEMNKLLLKKVEELTLHLIEKEKQLENQNERLVEIERKFEKFSKK